MLPIWSEGRLFLFLRVVSLFNFKLFNISSVKRNGVFCHYCAILHYVREWVPMGSSKDASIVCDKWPDFTYMSTEAEIIRTSSNYQSDVGILCPFCAQNLPYEVSVDSARSLVARKQRAAPDFSADGLVFTKYII